MPGHDLPRPGKMIRDLPDDEEADWTVTAWSRVAGGIRCLPRGGPRSLDFAPGPGRPRMGIASRR